jgi:phosphomannomutase/phosphoglucomutase
MQDTIFRMYDIRGKVGSELIITETYDLVRAIAYYFKEKDPAIKNIVIGMDGRIHSPAIKELACKAVLDSGLNVTFLGVIPSPVLYFTLHTFDADAGIMITASHNPKEYNGFKLCLDKKSLWGTAIEEIKKLYKEKASILASTQGIYQEINPINTYVHMLGNLFPDLMNLDTSFVIDCGNGATGTVIPELIKYFKWSNVQLLFPEIDGNYPHHEADPVVEENMQDVKSALFKSAAELGIGFDGDGDRMAAMTKQGYLVPGDQMLALLSADYVQKNPGAAVVCDIKSSSTLLDVITQLGGKAYLSPSGHSLVKKTMQENSAKIGGEVSGHFFFYDTYYGYDDGIYAALRLLSLLKREKKSLTTLVEQLPTKVSSPEFRIACAEEKKWHIVDAVREILSKRSDVTMITIDGIRAILPIGTGILRASNTQPVLSMRFEADTCEKLDEVKKIFVQAMVPHVNEALLKQHILLDKDLG